jgi:SAM-dependent methyltransferase
MKMTDSQIKNYYNSKTTNNPIEAQDYMVDGKAISYKTYKRCFIDPTLKHLNLETSHKVLDVGCGAGLILKEIENQVEYAEGIDISEKLLSMYDGNAVVRCGSAHELYIEESFYDRIYMVSVSIHFPSLQYFKEVATKLYNSLAPGGELLISDQIISDFYQSDKYFCISLLDLLEGIKQIGCHFSLMTQCPEHRHRNRYDLILYKPK